MTFVDSQGRRLTNEEASLRIRNLLASHLSLEASRLVVHIDHVPLDPAAGSMMLYSIELDGGDLPVAYEPIVVAWFKNVLKLDLRATSSDA